LHVRITVHVRVRRRAIEAHRGLISRETLAYDPSTSEILIDVVAGVEASASVAKV